MDNVNNMYDEIYSDPRKHQEAVRTSRLQAIKERNARNLQALRPTGNVELAEDVRV